MFSSKRAVIVENLTKNPLEKGLNSKRFSSFLSEKVNILRSEEGLDHKKIGLSLYYRTMPAGDRAVSSCEIAEIWLPRIVICRES